MIKYGESGENVKELQRKLERFGIDAGPVDGIFGPLTLSAWIRFEQEHLIDYKTITDEEFGVLTQMSETIPEPPAYSLSEEENFLRLVMPIAKRVMSKTGLPASVSVGQAIVETGYGKSALAKNALNYHGIKAGFGGGDLLPVSDFPEWTGRFYSLYDDEPNPSRFMIFDKIEDSFCTHDRWFCFWEHYHSYFAYAKDPYLFLKSISKHYATDSGYFDKVWSAIKKHGLTEIDKDVVLNIESPWKELYSRTVEPSRRKYKVAIMPGHGGNDPGAVNTNLNVREETYNWLEALEIKRILEGRGNYEVSICRQKDERVPLDIFKKRANATNADVCLCLHHNANKGKARGWWLFYVEEDARYRKFVRTMDKQFRQLPLYARGYTYAGKPFEQDWFSRIWNCISGCNMPTVLFESCFIDNDLDCQWLTGSEEGYKLIAQNICDGVIEYLED